MLRPDTIGSFVVLALSCAVCVPSIAEPQDDTLVLEEAVTAPATVPGVDVSHFQGEVDWQEVAASGQGFAMMKATEGIDALDAPADELTLPPGWSRWTFWQYDDGGQVPGIDGDADLSLFAGSLVELKAFIGVDES